MPVYTSSIEVTADYPTIKPSLNLNFARSRSLDPRITFTRASVGTYVGRDGLIKTAGEDEPRFDHDPVTLESLGLLIEESRTNKLGSHNGTYVGNFRQTNQGLNTTGPDGVINSAREFTVNSDGGTGGSTLITANANFGVGPDGNGILKSWSCFLKVTRSNSIAFQFYDNNNNLTSDVYTLYADGSDPLYQSAGNTGSVGVDKYPNGWYRFRWEGLVGSTNNTSYLQIYSQSHISSDGSNVGYAIWGNSFETGKFCTSPILTTGSSATRGSDIATIGGGGFSDFYNEIEGTIVGEFTIDNIDNSAAAVANINASSGSSYADSIMFVEIGSDNGYFGRVYKSSSGLSLSNASSVKGTLFPSTTPQSVAFAYTTVSGGELAAYWNGNYVNSNSSLSTVPSGLTELRIGRGWTHTSGVINARIKKLSYYPKRLVNNQLIAITS